MPTDRHPSRVIESALAYALREGWTVIKSHGGSAHAWGVEAVESVDGLEVVHVDPDELVWASEIAQRTGRSRQSVDQLIKGQRGPGNFPAPARHATRNPLWRWSEVEAWFAAYQGREAD